MENNVNLKRYETFVQTVTSDQSNETKALNNQLEALENDSGVNMALLLTGGIGLSSEAGELNEIIKKCIFQGKPLNDETIFHLSTLQRSYIFHNSQPITTIKRPMYDPISIPIIP